MRRPSHRVLGGVVLLAAVGWMALGLDGTVGDPRYVDDAWISFNYARSLASGEGFVFNPEDGPLEGFTNFLWVVICAGLIELGVAPEVGMRWVGLGCWAASLLVMAGFLLRLTARPFVRLAGALLLGTMALPHGLVALAGSGLETAGAAFCATALAALLVEARPLWGKRWLLAVLVQVAAFTIRLDSVIFLAAFSFALVLQERRRRGVVGALGMATLWQLPVVLSGVGFLAFKLAYFGDLLPNTYYAKSAAAASFKSGFTYWGVFVQNSPQTVLLLLLTVAGAFPGRGASAARYSLLGFLLYVVYTAKVGGDFMHWRFAFEAYPLLVIGSLVGLHRLACLFRWRLVRGAGAFGIAGLAVYASTTDPVLEHRYGMQGLGLMHAFVVDGTMVARRLEEVLPDDVRLATTLAGVIPYYTSRYVLDQWGLNDAAVARQPDVEVRGRGHVKRASEEYMRSRDVHLVVDHPELCSCHRRCDTAHPNVYVRLPDGRCLRTWYLVQEPHLTELFCSSREFITHAVDCEGTDLPGFELARQPIRPTPMNLMRFGALSASPDVSARWGFQRRPPKMEISGVAWGSGPVRRPRLPGQQQVHGRIGPYFSSYHGGDQPTGMISLPIPDGATRVGVLVGGGDDCDAVFAGIVDGDRILARACGQRDEVLRPVLFRLQHPARGLRFVAVDRGEGSWEHLIIDEVVVLSEGDRP